MLKAFWRIWSVVCWALLSSQNAYAQDAASVFEGNWEVEWVGVKEPDAPRSMRISIFRDRALGCGNQEMQGCDFSFLVPDPTDWNLHYLDQNMFVQTVGLAENGMAVKHAHGIFGRWGGQETLSLAGSDNLTGTWVYGDTTGSGNWRRARPSITGVSIRNPTNPAELTNVQHIGPKHIAVEIDASSESWNPTQNFPHARPKLLIELTGDALWGHHKAIFPGSTGFEPGRVITARGPDQRHYLEFEVTLWPGVQSGRHILHIAGQEVTLDIGLKFGKLSADFALDTGQYTRAKPLLTQTLGTLNPTVEQITGTVTSTGTDQFDRLRLTLTADLPMILSAAAGCTSTTGQSISCELASSNGHFIVSPTFFVAPFGGESSLLQAPDVRMSAQGLQNATGQWWPLGSIDASVPLLRCDISYATWIAAIDLPRFERVVAETTTPVDGLPGQRLFNGPGLNYAPGDDPQGLAYRVRQLTNTLAIRKGIDSNLADGGIGTQQLAFAVQTLKSLTNTENCSVAKLQADARILFWNEIRSLRRERAQVQNLYLNILNNVSLSEAKAQDYLKGASGQLPETARTILGVGGGPEKGTGPIILGTVASSLASARMLEAFSTVLNLSHAHFAKVPFDATGMGVGQATGMTRFTGIASLILSYTQIGISLADAAKLTEGFLDLEELASWAEAEAYVKGLLVRYDMLNDEFVRIQAILDNISVLPACLCAQ